MTISDLAVSYLYHKAISDEEKAKLSLKLLTENAVGIGDHSTEDYYKNLDETLDLLVEARDRLDTIREMYPDWVEVS